MIELIKDGNLIKWIEHLQDEDSSGAWNKKDDEIFKQILDDQKHSEWFKIIQDLMGIKELDDLKLGKMFQDIKGNKEKARKWDELELDEEDKDITLHGARVIKQNKKTLGIIEEFIKKELKYEENDLIGSRKDLEDAQKNPDKYQDVIQSRLRWIHACECMINRYKHIQKLLEGKE